MSSTPANIEAKVAHYIKRQVSNLVKLTHDIPGDFDKAIRHILAHPEQMLITIEPENQDILPTKLPPP